MFHQMRRSKQVLSPQECEAVLARGTAGVLALAEGDYPYAVPLSYVYADGKLFFHSAKKGHKLEAIAKNDRVSFCVIDQDCVVPDEYTTYFRSVIVFGRMRVLEDGAEKLTALELLAQRYAPSHGEEMRTAAINKEIDALVMLELDIHHMSGKESIELVRAKGQ